MQKFEHGFDSWIGKIPWRRKWQPTPVFLPGESHGQRKLAGYSPWGRKSRTRLSEFHYTICHSDYLIAVFFLMNIEVIDINFKNSKNLSLRCSHLYLMKCHFTVSLYAMIYFIQKEVWNVLTFFLFILSFFFLLEIHQFPTYFLSQMPEKCLKELIFIYLITIGTMWAETLVQLSF